MVNIVYPKLCLVCNYNLLEQENFICLNCYGNLPVTNYHLNADNPVEKAFWGRIPLQKAFSFLYFNNKGAAQKLLHQLKYKKNKELAQFLGVIYGEQLAKTLSNNNIQAIVAIPLHKTKYRLRGYNQSEWFAQGICEVTNLENLCNTVVRNVATETQTKKTRFERWQNVEEIFSVVEPTRLKNKHILLVDDVITTGATIEACAQTLIKIEGVKISIASIAYVN